MVKGRRNKVLKLTPAKVKYIIRAKTNNISSKIIAAEMKVSIRTVSRVWSYWMKNKKPWAIFGFLGPNGAGKSTAIRILTTLTILLSPMLYLMAFGWGLGRAMSVDGTGYLEFVVPGIIALTAMTTSFNGAGKAIIGVYRGLVSSIAFLLVALLIAPGIYIGPLFVLSLLLTCLIFSFLGVLAFSLASMAVLKRLSV